MMLRLVPFATLLVAALVAAQPARSQPAAPATPPATAMVPAPTARLSEVPPACVAPEDLTATDTRLPHVAAALKPGMELNILAVGSATMLGPGGAADGSFPFRMAAYLRQAVPGATVRLTVRSGRGLTASDMLATIGTELSKNPFQLVLWQTGTVEAVRNLPAEDFFQTLSDGAKLAEEHKADLVLIDPQFSRFLHANANLDPYEQTLEQTTGLPDVILFHRFELMRHWVSAGQIDLERTVRSDRQKTADLLHDCLGRALARVILQGAELRAP
jgi:hypothetical protein